MTRTWLAATAALSLMSGVALAQSSSSSSTTTTETSAPAFVPAPTTMTRSTTQQSVNDNGVVVDRNKTVTKDSSVTPFGDSTTTRKSSETTVVR